MDSLFKRAALVWAEKTGVVEFSKISPGKENMPGAASKN